MLRSSFSHARELDGPTQSCKQRKRKNILDTFVTIDEKKATGSLILSQYIRSVTGTASFQRKRGIYAEPHPLLTKPCPCHTRRMAVPFIALLFSLLIPPLISLSLIACCRTET